MQRDWQNDHRRFRRECGHKWLQGFYVTEVLPEMDWNPGSHVKETYDNLQGNVKADSTVP